MVQRPYRRGKNRCLICGKKLSAYHKKHCADKQKLIQEFQEVSNALKCVYGNMLRDFFPNMS